MHVKITLASLAACIALAACTAHETKTAERAASPLVGTWTRDGAVPKPDAKDPEFTRLAFAADGTLSAEYVAAAGALASAIGSAPKIRKERDTYAIRSSTIRIAEGSSYRDYDFRVDDGKLYLTPPGGSDAATFSKESGG